MKTSAARFLTCLKNVEIWEVVNNKVIRSYQNSKHTLSFSSPSACKWKRIIVVTFVSLSVCLSVQSDLEDGRLLALQRGMNLN